MEEKNQLPKRSRRRLGSILLPLLLIAFGILLLLDSLNLLGRSVWDILWNLWPLIFIALGLDALIRKREIFGPVFWIGLGSIFLLSKNLLVVLYIRLFQNMNQHGPEHILLRLENFP
jgi:hypothetical protein